MFYEDGHLLYAGGVADQPLDYLRAMAVIRSEINRLKYPDGAGPEESGNFNRRDQGLGEYCKGKDVEECRSYFGEGVLKRVCETCPN